MNDLHLVLNVMGLLERHGVVTWLFGGWAEELHGLAGPRHHHDVDLLYRAAGFEPVDRYLAGSDAEEIVEKRLPHKRAWIHDGVMIEVLLVQPNLVTTFWNHTSFAWPDDTSHSAGEAMRLASPNALIAYRRAHTLLHNDLACE